MGGPNSPASRARGLRGRLRTKLVNLPVRVRWNWQRLRPAKRRYMDGSEGRMAANGYVRERNNIPMSDENGMQSTAHVNFFLRSKRYTTSQLELMVDIPLPNYSLDLAVPRPPDRQFMGLSYHSPLNEDRSASVQEKLIALIEILEPFADKLHSIVDGDQEVKPPTSTFCNWQRKNHISWQRYQLRR